MSTTSSERWLEFEIPGPVPSGNHSHHKNHARTKASREFDARLKSIATAAALQARWVMPAYVEVELRLFNSRNDVDNGCKELLDPLQGIAFAFDSRVLRVVIERYKDVGPTRTVIRVGPLGEARLVALGYTAAMDRLRSRGISRGDFAPMVRPARGVARETRPAKRATGLG